MGDAAGHAGVGLEKRVHPVLVAGQDHDEIVALVLHHLQQDLDRLLPVVALVLGAVQVVGLVDEQHAAHRLLQHLLGLRCSVADVLAHQVIARDADHLRPAYVTEAMEDLRHFQRDRGLAGAGIAGETHVQARRLRGEAHTGTQLVDHQQCGNVANALLDRRQTDECVLQLVDHGIDLRLRKHLVDGAWLRRTGERLASDELGAAASAEGAPGIAYSGVPMRRLSARSVRPRAGRWRSCGPCSGSCARRLPAARGRSPARSPAG